MKKKNLNLALIIFFCDYYCENWVYLEGAFYNLVSIFSVS